MGRFDDSWRERLKDYKTSDEFVQNIKVLRKELGVYLPENKPDKKYLFVIKGLSGSGKTSISKEIAYYHPAVVLSSTWVFFTMLRDQIEEDYYKTYVYVEELAKHYFSEGYSVVLDGNARTVVNRTFWYNFGIENGAQPVLIELVADIDTAASRRTMKGGETKSLEENLNELKAFVAQTEDTTEKEKEIADYIRLDTTKPYEGTIQELHNRLKRITGSSKKQGTTKTLPFP